MNKTGALVAGNAQRPWDQRPALLFGPERHTSLGFAEEQVVQVTYRDSLIYGLAIADFTVGDGPTCLVAGAFQELFAPGNRILVEPAEAPVAARVNLTIPIIAGTVGALDRLPSFTEAFERQPVLERWIREGAVVCEGDRLEVPIGSPNSNHTLCYTVRGLEPGLVARTNTETLVCFG